MSDKSIVSCSEMAKMVGLSRQRFYQLVKSGIFPDPIYDLGTLRPFYDQDLQETCLAVRKRNTGVNGKPVLFYARRPGPAVSPKKRKPKPAPKNDHADLIDGLKGLGMVNVTIAQIDSAIHELFPAGIVNKDQAEVLRAVFLHLKRKESGG